MILILSTIALIMMLITLLVLPLFFTVSVSLYILLVWVSVMGSWVAGRGVEEIVYLWNYKIEKRRIARFNWYNNMGLLESCQLLEPGLAKDYWIRI